MKHFDSVEWLLYKNNLISLDKKIEMEEHLYNCDECLEVFLSSIDDEEIERAASIIPEDFTDNLVDKISKNKVKTIKPKAKKKSHINFGYYVAIASITIFLTMSGFFTNLVDTVPKIGTDLQHSQIIKEENIIYNFSEKIVDKTSEIISSIENMEEREIRRNYIERQE